MGVPQPGAKSKAESRNRRTAKAYIQGAFSKKPGATGRMPKVSEAEVGAHKAMRILPPPEALEKIMRYESHLHRLYMQTTHELEAMQARRRGESAPLARLDITSGPTGTGLISSRAS